MRFVVSRNYLLNGINTTLRAISPRNPNPILTGIKFELNKNGLFLTGSDSDLSILTKIPLEENGEAIINTYETGVFVLSSKFVGEIVRKLEGEQVEIETFENVAMIRDQISEFKLNCMSAEEYPPLDLGESGVNFGIEASSVKQIVDQVGFAASDKENRPMLTGVNFNCDGQKLTCVATDSYRLARKTMPLNIGQTFNVTIPAKTLVEIGRVLENERNVDVNISDKRACFKMARTMIVSRVISGTYPDTSKIVPDEFNFELETLSQNLANAIDRASVLAVERTNIVQLSMSSEAVSISSKSQEIGSVVEKLQKYNYTGQELSISFSAKYANEAIRAVGSEEIVIKFNGDMKPFVIVNKEDPSLVQLILPVRTY